MINKKTKQSRTVLAVIKNKRGKLLMAGDRRASWDFSQAQVMPRAKVVKRDGVLLGATGSGYLCTLLVDMLNIPVMKTEDVDVYMHHQFFDAVKKLLINKGFYDGLDKCLKIPGDEHVELLVGIHGCLYSVIVTNPDPYNDRPNGIIMIDELNTPYATGCGGAVCWGSLLTTEKIKMDAKDRLELAMNVAFEVSPGCSGPVDIIVE